MKRKFVGGDNAVRPDSETYAVVLNKYIKAGNLELTEEFLWEMVKDYLGGNGCALPRQSNFNAVLTMYAQGQKPQHAECFLNRFREISSKGLIPFIKPDAYSYSQLLKCW